jgi:GNAT superfamily N-acetyltransferase
MTTIRPFVERDYAAYIAVHNRVWPHEPIAESELRYSESIWDDTRFFKQRLVAEDEAGQPVGFGAVGHLPEQFHPGKYGLGVFVDPAARRRGHGGALYDALSGLLRQRQAISARARAKEADEASIRFATNRGFVEMRREWPSRLDVAGFEMERFAGAMERIAGQGITITTLADEAPANPNLWPEMYELDTICARDIPDIDPFTAMPYDDFVKTYITAPYVLPDAFFLAKALGAPRDRYVGVARLWSSEEEPDLLNQDLTGVIPEYRGKGIAMALKLKTVEYARATGKRQIRTWNDTLNRPMLRINEAMGFIKEPAEIAFLKDLTAGAATSEPDRTEGAAR